MFVLSKSNENHKHLFNVAIVVTVSLGMELVSLGMEKLT